MTAVLQAENVVRRLAGEVPVTLIDGVSLTVERGQFVCIMGPSGSGKSSLLYLLGLLDVPSSGRVWLDGEDTSRYGEEELASRRLEKLGFVFQFHFLLAEFTVLDNVVLPMRRLARLAEDAQRARGRELLERFGVGDQASKRPSQLSGGQRQRVAIA
ncbi:MAG TPA: ATP-binding cassette domain-containing protein, partial [Usitatibacter sp.]|nr:ATP-binding cassette domain-containing protein [Usitatibacter sp.]